MLPKCFQRYRVSIVSAVTAGDIGVEDGDLEQHRVRQTASLCEIEWAPGKVATPIALSATLCFKRGLPVGRTRTDLEGITSAVMLFYASTRSHFMLQVTTHRKCVCRALRGLHVEQRNWVGAASEVSKRRIVGVQLIASGLP
jgi:hypothetical protein